MAHPAHTTVPQTASREPIISKQKMKLVFLWVLMSCHVCRAQQQSSDSDILLQPPNVESREERACMQRPDTEAVGGEQELVLLCDIWAELRTLRDMVVKQSVELTHLAARVTAAESLVDVLQQESTAMEARTTTVESLAEELQMENDIQATELAVTQQRLSTLQQRLTVGERHVEELEKQQEGQQAAVQELQITSRVRKLAFTASLLSSGEGNTNNRDFDQLIYKNVITNIGNHYNQITGYFTAPVRGVYFFRFTGHVAHSDVGTRMGLVKNGHLIVTAGERPTTSTDAEDNVSSGVVLELEVADVVSVKAIGDVWDDHYRRTTFSGFLVFPL